MDINYLKTKYKNNLKFVTNINILKNKIEKLSDIKYNFDLTTCTNLIFGNITADPFIIKFENEYYIFYELMDTKKRRKGELHVTKIKNNGNTILFDQPSLILKKSYHLSYPYIFIDNDYKHYLIPENNKIGKIDLYEFIDFPYKIKFVKTLLDLQGKDTNLIYHESYYYLFTYVNNIRQIFYSNELLGTWIKHKYEEKINTDCDDGRNGGLFFKLDNNLYYPRQSNTNYYGQQLKIYKIIKLSIDDYQEEEVETIDNIHHLTFVDNILITDTFIF